MFGDLAIFVRHQIKVFQKLRHIKSYFARYYVTIAVIYNRRDIKGIHY